MNIPVGTCITTRLHTLNPSGITYVSSLVMEEKLLE